MPSALRDAAELHPGQLFHVIVQGRPAVPQTRVATDVHHEIAIETVQHDGIADTFSSINAVAADLIGREVLRLAARTDILAITPDAPLRAGVADPPAVTTAPSIAGAAETGASLSADPGQWAGASPITFTYQWRHCDAATSNCVDIPGADGPTYLVMPNDLGSILVVVVTAADVDGAHTAATAATPVVTSPAPPAQIAPPTSVALPGVTGNAVAGETLTAVAGTWASGSPLEVTRQWQRCSSSGDACADVPGATGTGYLLGPADVGLTIRVVETAADALGSAAADSVPTGVVAAAPAPPPAAPPTAPPPPPPPPPPAGVLVVAGTAQEGRLLEATGGQGNAGPYRWQRCNTAGDTCVDISAGPEYTPAAADVGSRLRVAVDTLASAPTEIVLPAAPVNVAPPAITGDLVEGFTLAATPGTWTSSVDLLFVYHWQRCDAVTASCTEIADGPSYTTTTADIGSTLRLRATAANAGGAASALSSPGGRIAPVSASGFWSWQVGPYAVTADSAWSAVKAANATPPAIAIVDSGVDPTLPGLQGAVVSQITLTGLPQSTAADGYGHGSFVAEIAAGRGPGEAGAAPAAPIVSLDVMNDDGMALTSDVIAAADWIYEHKDESNIRVANFSLISSAPSSVRFDPLDRALERLWLSGVVVVTAAGNYGVDGAAGDVAFAPANDPFVITVGAGDPAGTVSPSDDFAAPWSTFGHSLDGFAKPELGAPGRYVVAPVPVDSTLYLTRPDRIVAPGRLQLSGTSMAAPLVAGVAADLLALHPSWTPDQVKGALMLTAAPAGAAAPLALGVGEVDAAAALAVSDPPDPNAALEQFVVPDPAGGGGTVFDAASWGTTAQADASWGTASWGTASWGTASWGTASWGTTYWSSASWGTASWGTSAEPEDNSADDVLPAGAYWRSWQP